MTVETTKLNFGAFPTACCLEEWLDHNCTLRDFSGGPVVKNMSSIPSQRTKIPYTTHRNYRACMPQLENLCTVMKECARHSKDPTSATKTQCS